MRYLVDESATDAILKAVHPTIGASLAVKVGPCIRTTVGTSDASVLFHGVWPHDSSEKHLSLEAGASPRASASAAEVAELFEGYSGEGLEADSDGGSNSLKHQRHLLDLSPGAMKQRLLLVTTVSITST